MNARVWKRCTVILCTVTMFLPLYVLTGCPSAPVVDQIGDGAPPPSDATLIGSIGNQEVPLGATLTLELLRIETESVVFSAAPLPLPDNASFNVMTGVFSFHPDASQVGEIMLTFSATVEGETLSETITIEVLGAPADGSTALRGRVLDANAAAIGATTPIVGATVTHLETGESTTTDGEGFFLLSDLPEGENHFEYRGGTAATNGDFTYVGYRSTEDLTANVTNVIDRPIFLVRLDTTGQVEVDPNATTTLTNENIGVTLTIPPNTVMDDAGELFSGMLSISEVPADFTPASLPETLEPALVITVQPMGLTFDQPVPVTFPNVDNLTPGSELDLWSLDHATGEFVMSGTGRVSPDGSEIVTIDGGIREASWHFGLPPSGGATDETNSRCRCKKKDCEKKTGSQTAVASGELTVDHTLASYRSLGRSRALRLVYNSDRADPRPVISANVTNLARSAVPLTISTSLRVAGVDQGVAVFTDTTGLSESADDTIRTVFPFDASDLETGLYDYRLTHTSHYQLSAVSSLSFGSILVNNQSSSSFGAGWMLDGLARLHPQQDQSILLVEGDGSGTVFMPEPTGDNGLNLVLYDTPDPVGAVASGFEGLDPGSFTLTTADSTVMVTTAVIPVVNFADTALDPGAFFNVGPDGTLDGNSTATAPAGDDISIQPPGGNDTFGASFTGFLFVPGGGEVTFTVGIDDTFDLIVGGESVVQFLGVTDFQSFTSEPIDLPAGFVPLTLNYSESGGEANVVFSASGGGLPGGVVPERFLFRVIPDLDAAPTSFVSPAGDETTITRNDDGSFTRTLKHGTRMEFNDRGLQTAVVDRNGNTTAYGYDGSDNLVSITDPVGLITSLSYTNGRLSSVTDPPGRTTSFEHGAGGNLITITDPDNTSRRFAYDDRHHLISQTSKRGFVTGYTYDVAGKMVQSSLPDGSTRGVMPGETVGLVDLAGGPGTEDNPAPVVRPEDVVSTFIDGNGNQTTFATDPFGGSNVTTDPLGRTTTATRDDNGNPTQIISPNGALTAMTYDSRGNLLTSVEAQGQGEERQTRFSYEPAFNQVSSITDPAGNVTTFEYDTQGNLTRTTNPLGGESTFTYDSRGLPLSTTDANGNTTTFEYDTNGNPTSITDALGNVSNLTSDAAGNITAVTKGVGSPEERTSTFTYNDLNQILTSTDGTGATTQWRYDAAGNIAEIENATSQITTLTYDARERVSSINDPISGITQLAYDLNGNQIALVDGLNQTTTFEYDAANQLVKSTDPLGGEQLLEYDPEGNVVSFQDARAQTTSFAYDLLDRLTQESNPLGLMTTFTYDSRDNLNTRTDPIGQVITNAYDDLSRLIQITTPDNTISRTFDAAGNLLTVQDNDSSVVFIYDALNRVLTAQTLDVGVQPAVTLTNTYDAVGNRRQLADTVAGMNQCDYDAADRLTQLITPAGDTINLSSDPAGRLTQILFPNGVVSDHQYDVQGRLASLTHTAGGGTVLANLAYTYNDVGNILTIAEQTNTRQFRYDALQRVTGGGTAAAPETYSYDAVGNRTTSFLSSTHVHDAANRLLEDDGFTYTYDSNGNLTSKTDRIDGAVTTYTWDAQNQLIQIDFADATNAAYRYDGFGRRIEKNVDGTITRYVYDGPAILLEYDGTNTLTARYSHGDRIDQPLSMERGGQSFFYHADNLGSIRRLTDENGTIVNAYDYDSYGGLEASVEGISSPFSYTGREFDGESGLYYYRARYYDASIGRFLNEDPTQFLSGDVNFYAYVTNNPISFRDPSGLQDSTAAAAAGAGGSYIQLMRAAAASDTAGAAARRYRAVSSISERGAAGAARHQAWLRSGQFLRSAGGLAVVGIAAYIAAREIEEQGSKAAQAQRGAQLAEQQAQLSVRRGELFRWRKSLKLKCSNHEDIKLLLLFEAAIDGLSFLISNGHDDTVLNLLSSVQRQLVRELANRARKR